MKLIKWLAACLAAFYLGSLLLPPAFHRPAEPILPGQMATGERIACIDDNTDALIWRLRLIENAKTELILTTFGFSAGQSGQDMLAALQAAADRGVQVRLLLDGFHGKESADNPLFQTLAAHENVELRLYNELNLLTPWTANYRMHDKYLIADEEMYLLGGRNTNDLFLGDYTDSPNLDRDILVCSTGMDGTLGQLKAYFEQVWTLCRVVPGSSDPAALERLHTRYQELNTLYPTAFGFTDYRGQTTEAAGVALLTGQVHPGSKQPLVWNAMLGYMVQGSDIVFQTPYAVCGDEMYQNIRDLTAQGKQFTILTNAPETGANLFGCADYQNQKQNLLSAGITVLEYGGSASMHTKTLVIDENISIVGSFNLDMRSAYLDTETMLVIDCPALNQNLRQQMQQLSAQTAPAMAPVRAMQLSLLQLVEGFFRHLL